MCAAKLRLASYKMGQTTIQWTDRSWSPLRVRVKADAAAIATAKGYSSLVQIAERMAGHVGPHCEHVSLGCELCYAETNNHRCLPANGTGLPFDRRSRDLVEPFVDEKILMQPLKWRKPQRVFVENQSDLFGEWVMDEQIDRVFAVMALTPHITYQILTKRAKRMRDYMQGYGDLYGRVLWQANVIRGKFPKLRLGDIPISNPSVFPRRHIWLGVSCEDQATADQRIQLLRQTPAAVRFVSYEPALEWADLMRYLTGSPRLSWVVVGGESGSGARPFQLEWARQTIQDCWDTGVACFVKQVGTKPFDAGSPIWLSDHKGGDIAEWPEDLRVREFPEDKGESR